MPKVKVEPSSVEKSFADKLARAQERREKRFAARRVVYGYVVANQLTDNLLLLPQSTESAHKSFLERQISLIPKDERERYKNIEIVRLGVFDKIKLSFDRSSTTVIINCNDIFKSLEDLNVME